MLRKVLIPISAALLLGISWCTYRVGILMNWWDPLTRPATVSSKAHFVFLWESAAWFDCSIDTKRNVNVCKAWSDDGRLIASGDLRLKGENRAATQDELRPSTTGPTNAAGMTDVIYLLAPGGIIEGKELVRVEEKPARAP